MNNHFTQQKYEALSFVRQGQKQKHDTKLLGVARADRTTRVQVSVPLTEKVSAKVGYAKTNSTIGYFDVKEPSIEIDICLVIFLE